MNSVSSDDASLIINGQQRPARRSARQLSNLNDVSAENWKIKKSIESNRKQKKDYYYSFYTENFMVIRLEISLILFGFVGNESNVELTKETTLGLFI